MMLLDQFAAGQFHRLRQNEVLEPASRLPLDPQFFRYLGKTTDVPVEGAIRRRGRVRRGLEETRKAVRQGVVLLASFLSNEGLDGLSEEGYVPRSTCAHKAQQ